MIRAPLHAVRAFAGTKRQSGVATLFVVLIILLILTLAVLFSVNVGLFEQRTATNENRGRLAEQAAEYAANMAGEYFKARRDVLISNQTGGWMASGTKRWALCSAVSSMPANHPCMAERDPGRRAQLYFYTADGTVNASQSVPYRNLMPDSIEMENTGSGGSTAAFTTNTTVRALLCRMDTSLATPECRAVPTAGNRIALTILSDAAIPDENANATVKQVWATYSSSSPSSAVPLVASGLIKGVGNAQIVQNPNAAGSIEGSSFQASMWSPCEIDIEAAAPPSTPSGCEAPAPGNSVGSLNTCSLGEYLKQEDNNLGNDVATANLLTTCAGNGNPCGCPTIDEQDLSRSGHSGGTKVEGQDVLDRDGGHGQYPDIQFFPDAKYGLDKVADDTDDSLFEWIFNVNYESAQVANADGNGTAKGFTLQNCTVPASFDAARPTNCAVASLHDDFDATPLATCASLDNNSAGIYYVTGTCNLPGQVGSPNNFVIVVVNSNAVDVTLNGTIFYGMLFIRSDNDTAILKGVGNSKVFGSVIVQGKVDIAGSLDLVYYDTSITSNTFVLPKNAKFGLVPGSWLDNRAGF